MPQPTSVIGQNIFRELSGPEELLIVAHDIEQAFLDMLATGEFKQKVVDWLEKTGRFGAGACYPVVAMRGVHHFKVFASVESARSKEKMPPPFTLEMPETVVGEMLPNTELITEADVTIQRMVGFDTSTAVDRVRLETGQVPLVPTRTETGAVVNAPGKHSERAAGYQERFAKSKATVLRKKAERELAAKSEEERLRVMEEGEARNHEG